MQSRKSTARKETPRATVRRITALLDLFAEAGGGLGVTDLAERLGFAKSVVHRLVVALTADGYLTQDGATRRYSLGRQAIRIGQASLGRMDIRARARPHLVELAKKTGETATLSIRVGDCRVYAEQVESSQTVRQSVQIGSIAPLHVGASGKAILANLPRTHVDAVLARIGRSAPMFADGRRLSVTTLRRELGAVHVRGFAVSQNERILGATSAAAPVFDHSGQIVGAISVASVSVRHDRDDLLAFGRLARKHADRLSRDLGSTKGAIDS